MRDQDHGHTEALFQRSQQFHDLRLDGHVQRSGRLVRDQHVRLAGQRHGDHDALLHSAAQLVRIIVHAGRRIDDADRVEPAHDLRIDVRDIAAMQTDRLPDLAPHRVNRVERRAWLLENVGDLSAAQLAQAGRVHRHDAFAIEEYFPAFDHRRRHRQQPRQGQRGHAFAAATLANDGQGLTGGQFEGSILHRFNRAVFEDEIDAEVADLEDGLAHCLSDRVSTACRSASPVR